MSDQELEGAPVVPEAEEPAVPQVSEVDSEVQPPSVPSGGITEDRIEALVSERLNARIAELEEKLEKQAQSAKDRGISANAKQINEILSRLDQLGGNREALIQEIDQQSLLNKVAQLEAQISRGATAQPVQMPSAQEAWQVEWREESQKILDAAAKSGVSLTPEELNSAMFNNGIAFKTKGDAYAALNQAIVSKAKGEAIPVAAVATEGGDVAQPPAPPAGPKTATQKFQEAKAAGDQAAMRAALDEQWESIEQQQNRLAAQQALEAAGLTAKDLLEQ